MAGRGPVPVFCSGACRQAAYREWKAAEALPQELTARRRWVRRDESKRPVRADNGRPASVTNPFDRTTFPKASRSRHGVGLGFVLDAGDGLVCVDLDHALGTDGRPLPWAREILDRCPPTFVEVSPSGTGLHIWGRGRVRQGRRIRRADGAGIEVYGDGRYIAVGRRFGRAPLRVADLTELVAELTE
ncbi:DNA primase [Streptomyces aidingensis]|uniref:Bifunctional DNA primase/polymerase, N-terminal n=1 Tax=Streptomyces aidingensis TaxID=910347 RepID=A0A1I1Q2T8_9ACTN|nr:DNA primase [Streptomyces aidingensis]SFD14168.1 hypothetical protein SAMN05421773_11099 [Streptomyces aidingensis]